MGILSSRSRMRILDGFCFEVEHIYLRGLHGNGWRGNSWNLKFLQITSSTSIVGTIFDFSSSHKGTTA